MNELQLFQFESREVRTVVKNDEIWFVAKDVAEVLGYSNTRDAIAKHCKAASSVAIHDGTSGNPNISIIPERDIYRLVMKSKLPSAERFEEWVVGEVLPSIRRTGKYEVQNLSEIEVARRWVTALEDKARLEQQLIEQKPKVKAFDSFLGTKNSFTFNEAAKELGTGQNRLFDKLRTMGILFDDGPNKNIPKQSYIERGYFTVRKVTIDHKTWSESKPQTMVTAKGLAWLHRKLTPQPEEHAA